MKHLDLFSGIGGFAVAARSVGWQTIGFCEIDPFCLSVLQRRFDCDGWFSLPGLVHCWPESGPQGVQELAWIKPDWLVIENIYQAWRSWVPELRLRLYELGYASLPLRVSAADVGAVHRRARGWVVANADSERLRLLSGWFRRQGRAEATLIAETRDSAPRRLGADDGLPDWAHRRKALGNAIDPHAAELIFRGIEYVTYETGGD